MKDNQLEQIHERINKFKSDNFQTSNSLKKESNFGALSISIDLLASTGVGIAMGIFLDRFFESKPLCLIVFSLIGILAGFKMIWQKWNNKNNVS